MMTIHITEAEPVAVAAAAGGSPDGLAACLAQYGVPPDVIQTALAALAHVNTLWLYKPSEEEAWEIHTGAC